MPKSLLFSTILLLFFAVGTFAQQDDEDAQSWNDVQVTVPINKKVDFTLYGTLRFGSSLTQGSEGRVGAGFGFHIIKAFSGPRSYLAIASRNSAGRFHDEHRLSLRGTYKFPTKGFALAHRSTYEYRVRTAGNSWRYRAALVLDKKLPEKFIPKSKLFVIEEVFYVSTTKKFSRNRFSVGISKELDKHLTLELYYLRQNDGYSHPGDLNVIGTSWKIHL